MPPDPTTRTRTGVRAADLREYDDFTKNFVLDYKPVTVYAPPPLLDSAGALNAMGNGNAPVDDINTSDIGSMTFATADILGFRVELPYDMDVRQDVGFRVKWQKVQAVAAATGACLWGLTYEQKQIGVSTTGAGVAATALDTIIANQVDVVQYVSLWSSMGVINANTLAALTAGTDCLDCTLLATLDTITDGTLDCIQMWYRPRLL